MEEFNKRLRTLFNKDVKPTHPKCLGYYHPDPGHGYGDDGGCEYESEVDCNECMYNSDYIGKSKKGLKYPDAKCNQIDNSWTRKKST